MDVDEAIEVFVRAFAFLRSFTHPFVARRVGPLWLVEDGPRKSGDYRRSEAVAHNVSPAECRRLLAEQRVARYVLCAFQNPESEPKSFVKSFKDEGFGYFGKEFFMVKHLDGAVHVSSTTEIKRITTPEDAAQIAKAARSRQVLPEHLASPDPPIRLYAAFKDGLPVGWVRSVQLWQDRSWVSNLFVDSKYRRMGFGHALMSAMLDEDSKHGVTSSVLLASSVGSLLYPHLGYKLHGALHLFYPPKVPQASSA